MLSMYNTFSRVVDFERLPDPTDVWELGPVIGEGTYGAVYRGAHRKTGEEVAIKVLESIHEMMEEIEEEYQVLRDLSEHPNMPRFHGIFLKPNNAFNDQIWLVMEICSGGSVTALSKNMVKNNQHLEEPLIAHIIKETLNVLHHLHEHNVMHRDIKGHNILISHTGGVKLIDFGVSGHLDSHSAHRKTHVGTPYWMAPEVIACEQQLDYSYDVRCDVWSLGVTAIELAEGRPPHSQIDPRRALFAIPRNPPPKLSSSHPWSAEFHDFIAKCLVKDFEKRPFTRDLLSHPFLQQVPRDTTQLSRKLVALTSSMEQIVHAPDVTTKNGQLKSNRKSRRDASPTADDLASLEVLDEEVIVNQLSDRYQDEAFYTYIGDILLAVNPFTPLTIYTQEYARRYMHAAKAENSPHIFAVADQSYQSMMHHQHNQCIVISGESGAGKTESANLLVQQLTHLGKAENRGLEDKILQVNPLMEAFGNAKTVINDNSSRFGKYLEMFFTTSSGVVVGAKITEYLLEKSRVIYQASGEQNFHIFYYIHDGLSSNDHEDVYHLKENTTYRYIQEYTSHSPDVASVSVNRVKFKAIAHCFDIIGFEPDEVKSVYQVLAAILHTGNMEFRETDNNHGGDSCTVANPNTLTIVSQFLGLDATDLQDCLTSTGMVAKGEVIIRGNSVQEAVDARDAMSKALYGRLFSWIVNRISALLRPGHGADKKEDRLVTGLLDIFGFENFKTNSFEQLCINIANEQIQYYFNQHIFAWELAEYDKEGIDATEVSYVDNRPILDMFLSKPVGLLSLLDEESHFPKASDHTLVDKFNQNIHSAVYSKLKGNSLHFNIDHFAGKVEYDATGFLEKNRDRLPVEIMNILRTSDNRVVRTLFQTPLTKTGNLASGLSSEPASQRSSAGPSPMATMTMSFTARNTAAMGGSKHVTGSTSMTRIQQTVSTYFRFSLMDLLNKMVAGTPHFVRCIKPNDVKEPGNFDTDRVQTQLRYTGVLETTRIRRQGYSHRISFGDFLRRYHVLGLYGTNKIPITQENCILLLNKLNMTGWAIGKTKVFLKYYHVEELAQLYENLTHRVVLVQSLVRAWIARFRFRKIRIRRQQAAVTVQRWTRGWFARRQYKSMTGRRHKAAASIQKVVRGYQTRKRYQSQIKHRQKAAKTIQGAYRKYRVRSSMKNRRLEKARKRHTAAMVIQRAFRFYRAKKKSQQRRALRKREGMAVTVIQAYFRMWKAKTFYKELVQNKSKEEIQMIFFGQQVELYGQEMSDKLQRVDASSVVSNSVTGTGISTTSRTSSLTNTGHAHSLPEAGSSGDTVPVWKRVTKGKVGEARLVHMRKMHDTKSTMPPKEARYYDGLNGNVEKQDNVNIMINGETPSASLLPKKSLITNSIRRQLLSASKGMADNDEQTQWVRSDSSNYRPGSQGEFADTSENNNHLNERGEAVGAESSQNTQLSSRLYLAKSAARTLMANKPDQPEVTVTSVMPDDDSLSDAWDAPLLSAQQYTLSPHFDGSGYISPCSIYSIEADLMAEKDELFEEEDKHELARRLEQEVAGSFLALWRERLTMTMMPQEDIEIHYDTDDDDDDDDSTGTHTPTSTSPRSPPSPQGISHQFAADGSGGDRGGSSAFAYMRGGQNSRTGSLQSEENYDESNSSLEAARLKLRKTRFDYSKDTLRRPVDVTPQQVDFRHVLKRGSKLLED